MRRADYERQNSSSTIRTCSTGREEGEGWEGMENEDEEEGDGRSV